MALLERPTAESPREMRTPVLETERLVLRAPRADDANAIASLVNDRRIAEMLLRVPHPYTLADGEDFIARTSASKSEKPFAITLAAKKLIGLCGLHRLDTEQPEVGYWLGVPFWRNGYATEAARAVIDHAFADLGCDALVAGARVSNPASRRVLEKCGFQWTGVILCRIRSINSAAPFDRFRLDRKLWASLKSWGAAPHLAPP